MEGGIIFIGRNSSGVIPFIPAGMEEIISSTLIIGFGPVKIIVEVWIPGGPYVTHEQLGFVFFFYIKVHTFGWR